MIRRAIVSLSLTLCLLVSFSLHAQEKDAKKTLPAVVRSARGDSVTSPDGRIRLVNIGKRQQFNGSDKMTFDTDIHSPKSVGYHPDGSRVYVNSLEGGRTVVYDARYFRKLKVINHKFDSGTGPKWAKPSGYYTWTHYADGERRPFMGKPVEMAFSHQGRYLWVPYYRRTFDINAQDPSAMAVIDTRGDTIVRMFETGPLPKMVAPNHDGTIMAVTHWGDNTVGFIDISSDNPTDWHHLPPVAVGKKLKLDFPLNESVNRDANSGNLLRGTLALPDGRYMLIGCMAGSIAVIDLKEMRHVGFINDLYNVRHLVLNHGNVYASCNVQGIVARASADSISSAIRRAVKAGRRSIAVHGWQRANVGKGARTLEVSPDGRYAFAACNFDSRVDVVDTRTMRRIASIRCDSYPVGLAVSPGGKRLVVTSQGREHQGGNAVNIFNILHPKQ